MHLLDRDQIGATWEQNVSFTKHREFYAQKCECKCVSYRSEHNAERGGHQGIKF